MVDCAGFNLVPGPGPWGFFSIMAGVEENKSSLDSMEARQFCLSLAVVAIFGTL